MSKFEIGDLVVVSNPQKGYEHLKHKAGVVISYMDGLKYVELIKKPIVSDSNKELIYGHSEMKNYFGNDAYEEHRIYLAHECEIKHITVSKYIVEQLDWVYCVGDKLYKIPKDYFDGE